MADKEATVYIVDVGKSMGRRGHGRSMSDLEWAMRYIWDKITTTVWLAVYRECYTFELNILTGCYRTENSNRWSRWT